MINNTTIYDIAKMANVSSATVSRVIHTPLKVSEAVRTRVHAAMEELNYSYNAAAANMAKGTTNSIGIITPLIRDHTFSKTLVAIQKKAYLSDYHVIVAESAFDAKIERQILKKFVEQRVAGILLIGYCNENEKYILKLNKSGMRIIVLWEILNNSLSFIGFDNYNASKQVVEYLISLKHEKILCIFGQYKTSMRVKSKADAWFDTLERYSLQIDEDMLIQGLPTLSHGYDTVKFFLENKKKFTAIVCNNDLQAFGAIKCLRDNNIRVPEDISVCGYDDIDTAIYFEPAMTTVRIPAHEVGELAINTLLGNILENKIITSKMLETEFIIRDSCAKR